MKIPAASPASDTSQKDKIKTTVVSSSSTVTSTVAAVPALKNNSSSHGVTSPPPLVSPPPIPKAASVESTPTGVRMTIDDIVLEEKPKLSEIVKQSPSTIDPAAMEAAGLTTVIKESKPVILPLPVVEKQRAIVKPQILTHFIEGFIIQEGLEPFPVSTERNTHNVLCVFVCTYVCMH